MREIQLIKYLLNTNYFILRRARNTAVRPTLPDSSLTNLDFRHAAAVEDVCQRGLRHPLRGLRVEDLRCFLLMRVRLPIYNGFKLLLWI